MTCLKDYHYRYSSGRSDRKLEMLSTYLEVSPRKEVLWVEICLKNMKKKLRVSLHAIERFNIDELT